MWDDRNKGTWIFLKDTEPEWLKPHPTDPAYPLCVAVEDPQDPEEPWYGYIGGHPNFPKSGPPLQPPTPTITTLTTCDDCGLRFDASTAPMDVRDESRPCPQCERTRVDLRAIDFECRVEALEDEMETLRAASREMHQPSVTSTAKPAQRGPIIYCDSGWDD